MTMLVLTIMKGGARRKLLGAIGACIVEEDQGAPESSHHPSKGPTSLLQC
jgi:hypothetical protein